LIVGAGTAGQTAVSLLRDVDFRNSTVAAVLDPDTSDAAQNVETGGGLLDHVRRLDINEIVLAHPDAPRDAVSALIECQERGIEIVTLPQLYEDLLQRVPVRHLGSDWLFTSFVESIRAKDASRVAKRCLDIAGGSVGLIALGVLTPLVACATWIDSGGPVFFRQRRTGRAGREFTMLKFRTMVRDAESDTGPQWSGPRDPRVTRVGRILRRLRLDELPNVVNVLRGEMSLVGPRPERPELVALLERQIPFYRTRLIVRPGITGWAQVNRPYGDSVHDAVEKLEYDLYYLKHRSLLFDLRILVRTVGTVMRFEGR
jgi:exopolysaccharide biosynthesis polyprenyl glycosylphosphotransferase